MNKVLLKHFMLLKISENKESNVSLLASDLNLDLDICFSLSYEIHTEGYIDFINSSSKDGKDAIIKINGSGKLFISQGDYIEMNKNELTEVHKHDSRSKLNILSNIIIAITSTATVFLLIFNNIQKSHINNLELQIKNPKKDLTLTDTLNSEDFKEFINTFCIDSDFQINRIQFPLKATLYSNLKEDFVDTLISKSNWKHSYLFMNDKYIVQTYDNFNKLLQNSNERLVSFEGIENGISVNYYFKRINGHWFLIKYEDTSD